MPIAHVPDESTASRPAAGRRTVLSARETDRRVPPGDRQSNCSPYTMQRSDRLGKAHPPIEAGHHQPSVDARSRWKPPWCRCCPIRPLPSGYDRAHLRRSAATEILAALESNARCGRPPYGPGHGLSSDKLEADLAKAVMSLPATRFEIGSGLQWHPAEREGEHNDASCLGGRNPGARPPTTPVWEQGDTMAREIVFCGWPSKPNRHSDPQGTTKPSTPRSGHHPGCQGSSRTPACLPRAVPNGWRPWLALVLADQPAAPGRVSASLW